MITGWEGPRVETQDLRADSLYGDRFVRDIEPGSTVRVSVGWKSGLGFEPFAIGAEVTAPRIAPVKTTSLDVAKWEPKPPAAAPTRATEPKSPAPPTPPPQPAASAPTPAPYFPVFAPPPPAAGLPSPPTAPVSHGYVPAARSPVWAPPPPTFASPSPAPECVAVLEEVFEEVFGEEEDERLVEGSWWRPGGASELGRGGPSRTRARRILRAQSRSVSPAVSPILPGFPSPVVPLAEDWSPPWVGGASELIRPQSAVAFGGASDLTRPAGPAFGGASDLCRVR